MRLVDVVFRSGHLSEAALVRAFVAGVTPQHLDRCEICAERAINLTLWLDRVREIDIEAADAAFTPPRLAMQQAQILRRLEQLDRAARVISFPSFLSVRHSRSRARDRRVAPAWLGVATAAGVALGVFSSQVVSRLGWTSSSPPAVATSDDHSSSPAEASGEDTVRGTGSSAASQEPALFDEVDRPGVQSLEALASLTPRQAQAQLVSLRTPSR